MIKVTIEEVTPNQWWEVFYEGKKVGEIQRVANGRFIAERTAKPFPFCTTLHSLHNAMEIFSTKYFT